MPTPRESFVRAGEEYLHQLKQFETFRKSVTDSIASDPIPSFEIQPSDESETIQIEFVGRTFCFRHRLMTTAAIVDPNCQYSNHIACERVSSGIDPLDLVVDKHGNVTVSINGNNIGNIEKDALEVLFTVINHLAS